MGNCVGGFKRRTTRIAPWKRNRTIVLAFLGIDGAGKTTIVKALQGEDFGTVHPTMGFSRAEMSVKKYKLTVYDLGGSQRIRDIWPTYFAEVYGLVFVVDSSALSRLQENKQMVDSLYEVPELMGKPILFLLNKKDLPEALDEMQFSDRFTLHSMAKRNRTDIRVEGVCAVKGTGKEIDKVIVEGLEWLIEKILDNYESISKGVEQALKKLKERQAQERLERQHRLALAATRAAEDSPEEARSRPETGENDEAAGEGQTAVEAEGDQAGKADNGLVENGDLLARGGTAERRERNEDGDGQKPQTSRGRIGSRPPTAGGSSQKQPRPSTGGGRPRTAGGSDRREEGQQPIDYGIFEINNSKEKREELEMQERRPTNGDGRNEALAEDGHAGEGNLANTTA